MFGSEWDTLYYKPRILPFDVHTVILLFDIVSTIVEALVTVDQMSNKALHDLTAIKLFCRWLCEYSGHLNYTF